MQKLYVVKFVPKPGYEEREEERWNKDANNYAFSFAEAARYTKPELDVAICANETGHAHWLHMVIEDSGERRR